MKKLLISLAVVVLGVFVADRIGGCLMWWVNQHTQDVSGPKLKYLVNDVHEDVLFMGTSRANCHYVPSIIADTLGMSVYNGGVDASNCIYAHYYILCHILSHYTPKVICLEVMPSDYAPQKEAFETTSFFAPYFGRNAQADSIFREAGTYWMYKLSHLYRYNAKAFSNLAGLLYSRQEGGDRGYIYVPKPPHFPEQLRPASKPEGCDSLKLYYMQRFVTLCHERNIRLVFVVSPSYSVADPHLYDVLKDLAARNSIPFFDYHTSGLYHGHPEYFKDAMHLWDQGSRLYSSVFAHDLKRWLEREGEKQL